jgi:hypothetical protein
MPGLRSLGSDVFTCNATTPRARHHRLRRGSLIKLAVIGQGARPKPVALLKPWFAARFSVKAFRRGALRGRVLRGRRAGRCQLIQIKLPYRHGRIVVRARAFGGVERRTIRF